MWKLVSISALSSSLAWLSAASSPGLRHQDHELVAAVAEAQVLLAAQFLQALARSASNSLPTRWPCTSLTSLKRSRSRNARLNGASCLRLSLQLAAKHIVEMAHVVEAGGVVGDGELLDARHVARIFNGDGGVVGQNVQEGDGVVGHLSARGLKISITPCVPLRPRKGMAMTDRTLRIAGSCGLLRRADRLPPRAR